MATGRLRAEAALRRATGRSLFARRVQAARLLLGLAAPPRARVADSRRHLRLLPIFAAVRDDLLLLLLLLPSAPQTNSSIKRPCTIRHFYHQRSRTMRHCNSLLSALLQYFSHLAELGDSLGGLRTSNICAPEFARYFRASIGMRTKVADDGGTSSRDSTGRDGARTAPSAGGRFIPRPRIATERPQ